LILLPFCLNCLIVYYGREYLPIPIVLLVGSIISTFFSEFFVFYQKEKRYKTLAIVLIISTIALLFFDWKTEHKTISIEQSRFLNWLVISLALFSICWQYLLRNSLLAKQIKLGVTNKWVVDYWFKPDIPNWRPYYIIQTINWFVITYLIMSGTGVTSSLILKFVIFAILIAEISDIRGPKIILVLSLFLSLIRVLIPLYVNNKLAPLFSEFSVLSLLLFYIGYFKSRSKLFNRDAN